MKLKDRNQRISEDFLREIQEIKALRMKEKLDTLNPIGLKRLTSAMIKEPEWKSLKDKLSKMPRNLELDSSLRRKKK